MLRIILLIFRVTFLLTYLYSVCDTGLKTRILMKAMERDHQETLHLALNVLASPLKIKSFLLKSGPAIWVLHLLLTLGWSLTLIPMV